MPKAVFLCGLPASGKSTYAQSLMTTGDYVLLSSDTLIEAWAAEAGMSYQDAYLEWRDKAKQEILSTAEWALEEGINIIWDQTNLTWEERQARLDLFNDYDLIAVAFEMPDDVLDRRLAKREAETGKHIPPDVLDAQRARYERPHFDEGFDNIVLVTPKGATCL